MRDGFFFNSGLKRKFVRNTRTQTSPQYSSSSSSTELSSPLETPLPRKRPPVPMARVSKNERDSSRKRVHFDPPKARTTTVKETGGIIFLKGITR